MRARAVLVLVRIAALVALVAVLRADVPTDVLGRHDDRPAVVAQARSRRTHAALRQLGLEPGPPIERATTYVEITTGLDRRGATGVKDRDVVRGALPVLRSIEVGADQLLVVGLDAQGRVRYSATMPDPTRIRAEFPDANGVLHGEVIDRPADIELRVPDDEQIVVAQLYRMDGSNEPLGSFEVR